MPYFEVEGASIYDRLREPHFHIVNFYDGVNAIPQLSAELSEKWTGLIDSTTVSLYPQISDVFGWRQSFYVLLRPDNYIGLISGDLTLEGLRNYLSIYRQA